MGFARPSKNPYINTTTIYWTTEKTVEQQRGINKNTHR